MMKKAGGDRRKSFHVGPVAAAAAATAAAGATTDASGEEEPSANRGGGNRRKTIGGEQHLRPPIQQQPKMSPAKKKPPPQQEQELPQPQAQLSQQQPQQQQQPNHPKMSPISNKKATAGPGAGTASAAALLSSTSKTPTKHRVALGAAASSYYFKNAPKTPLEKAIAAKRKLDSSMTQEGEHHPQQQQQQQQDNTLDSILASLGVKNSNSYDGSLQAAAETSFLSSDSSSTDDSSVGNRRRSSAYEGGTGLDNSGDSNSSGEYDLLNRSTLSDTTELTASNFVRIMTGRQQHPRLSLLSVGSSNGNGNVPSAAVSAKPVAVAAPSPRQENKPVGLPADGTAASSTNTTGAVQTIVVLPSKEGGPAAAPEGEQQQQNAVIPRKPLGAALHVNKKQRNSLPPPATRPLAAAAATVRQDVAAAAAAAPSESVLLQANNKRRESWHGSVATMATVVAAATTTAASINNNNQNNNNNNKTGSSPLSAPSLLTLAANLRERRLQREEQRRFSNGSVAAAATSELPAPSSSLPNPPRPSETAFAAGSASRKSLGEASTASSSVSAPPAEGNANTSVTLSASMRLPELSPIVKSTSGGKRSGRSSLSTSRPDASNNNTSTMTTSSRTSSSELDTSKRTLDDLFDGLLPATEDKHSNDDEMNKTGSLSFLDDDSIKKKEDKLDESAMSGVSANDKKEEDKLDESVMSASATSMASGAVASQVGSSSRLASTSRRSSVSSASTLTSATGIFKAFKRSPSSAGSNKSSRPLPDAIAFEASISPLNAVATSPFRYDKGDRNGTSLTPTQLNKLPRRSLDPTSVDSPARRTRSAEKKRRVQEEEEHHAQDQQQPPAQQEEEIVGTASTQNVELMTGQPNVFSSPIRRTSSSVDSPARRTRSAEKSRKEEEEEELQQQQQQQQLSSEVATAENIQMTGNESSPRRNLPADLSSIDSPARRTRSAEKKRLQEEEAEEASDDADLDTESKRKRVAVEAVIAHGQDMDLDDSVTLRSQKRRKSTATGTISFSSVLRRSGSTKNTKKEESARKTVAFGSPEIQHFNKTSPSFSVTPGAKARLGWGTTEEATVEMEADMTSVLHGTAEDPPDLLVHKEHAGSTPFALKKGTDHPASRENDALTLDHIGDEQTDSPEAGNVSQRPLQALPSSGDSRMSVDSSSEDGDNSPEVEHTTEIDFDMAAMIRSEAASSSNKKKPPVVGLNLNEGSSSDDDEDEDEEAEHTEEMDIDMDELLGNDESALSSSKKPSVSSDDIGTGGIPQYDSFVTKQDGEEDETVEFTMNITNYLEGAGGESHVPTSSANSMSLRRRRSSLSSRRFSLAPGSRLSLSSIGSSQGERDVTASSCLEQTQLSAHSGLSKDETCEEAEEATFNLKNREIVEACGLTKATFDDQSDILCTLSETITDPTCALTMMNCIASACNTLHQGVDRDLDGELDEVFEVSDDQREEYLVLQKAVRSGGNPELQCEVSKLVGAVRQSEQEELLSWLVSVAERLNEELCGEADEMREKLNETDLQFQRVDGQYEKLSKLETKAARKARRKSLVRRQENASNLEAEIANLEAQLESAQGDLETAKKEHSIVSAVVASVSQQSTLTEELSTARPRAEASERDYTIVSGLGKLRPALLNEENLRFHFVGPCPTACIAISFDVCNGGHVACRATMKPDLFPNEFKGRPLKSPSLFYEARIPALCTMLSSERLESATDIGAFLRRVEWTLCRLEQTGSELAMLQRRYKAQLVLDDPVSASILLEVVFSSQTTQAMLLTTFEISQAYPFSPVNVELDVQEGDVDMDGIRAVLIKHANPNAYVLSRTCDMIAAFLR